MSARLWLVLPAGALFFACIRCASSEPPPAPPADAAIDADSAPAIADASRRDVVSDNDAFVVPDAGAGWKWFAAFGPTCTKYSVPIDPKKELPAITWQTCATALPFASGATTCVEWDWKSMTMPNTASQGGATVSGDGRYLSISRLRESSAVVYDGEQDLYDRATLEPLAAWRFRNPGGAQGDQYDPCLVKAVVAGRAAPFLHAPYPTFAASVSGSIDQLMTATSYDRLVPELLPYPNAANSISASDSTEAFLPAFGQRVIRVNRSDMTWVRANASDLNHPLVVKDDVFARDHRNPWYRLSRVEPNGDVTVVRDVPSHHILGLADDGTSLYWLELSGTADSTQAQPHMELWRSTYTRDIAAFNANAEQIVALDGSFNFGLSDSLIYDGVFATGAVRQAFLVRLSDKKAKILPAASNMEIEPFYVDQNELWLKYIVDGRPVDSHYAKVGIAW